MGVHGVKICKLAASSGELKCLMYAHGNGCPWTINTCIAAAINGNLECLRYAHENGCGTKKHELWLPLMDI